MREIRNLDLQWKFHLGDAPDAFYMAFDDAAWRQVTLPHDWAVEHPFDPSQASGTGYLPGGTGWYRKHFTLTDGEASKRVLLTFQGVYKHARVWINSNYLGDHAYGYTSFSFDISEYVRPGENIIAVRAEHEQVADSRWYTGSGIDRHVILTLTEKIFLQEDVFAWTAGIFRSFASLKVQFTAENHDSVRVRLLNREGKTAARKTDSAFKGRVELDVKDPHLWSPEDPYLYTLLVEALWNGQVMDQIRIPFGIRTVRFDANQGFFLNGQNMKIKGVCVHHDAGCLGAAVPKNVWRIRLETLKRMGCNAIRTAHNPPDPDLLNLCDEMGFLVMDEAFDEWEGIKNKWWQGHNVYPPKHFGYGEDFPRWHGEDLRSMVLRDRNHPCVILWSIGNEIDYPNDPYVTPLFRETMGNNDANKPLAERLYDVRKPDAGRLPKVARELVQTVHSLDSTRPVTSAMSFPELSNRTGFAGELDISGYNYREQFYEEDHAKDSRRVILGSENSHDPACWRTVEDHDYISGQFLWTGIDFLGECPGWPRRISQAGALDLRGKEKPQFAQRQALWTSEPMARLAVSRASEDDRGAWGECFRWQGAPGEMKRVSCYTNQGEAELFLNGRSLGRQPTRRENGFRAVWTVPYEEGVLEARAGNLLDQLISPGKAAEIEIEADWETMPADGREVLQLEVTLLDESGHPAQDEIIYCDTLGDIQLLGLENGIPDDLTPYSEAFRRSREGSLTAYIRAGRHPGKALVHFRTDHGLTADWKIKTV